MFLNDNPMTEVEAEPGALTVLHGYPVHVLLEWHESGAAPSPEIREALRMPLVRSALREIAARRRVEARASRRSEVRARALAAR